MDGDLNGPGNELKEVQEILVGLGVEEPLSRQVAVKISKDKTHWADFMISSS